MRFLTSYIFGFTIATSFARDSRQQYPFMHKCNFTLNTLSSIAYQTARLPLGMRFYNELNQLTRYYDFIVKISTVYQSLKHCIYSGFLDGFGTQDS